VSLSLEDFKLPGDMNKSNENNWKQLKTIENHENDCKGNRFLL
jgi:hypothetical protein